MKKKMLIVIAAILLCQTSSQISILLESPILSIIDGREYGVNGIVFGLILKVRKDVREMVYGKKTADGQFVGIYMFDGKFYNLLELVDIENQENVDHAQLEALLEKSKEDFLDITKGYVDSIRSFKSQILQLIDESCKKRNKKENLLVKWGEELEGEEGKFLRMEITSFSDFAKFCEDLTEFLEDMAVSCPKGKALFLDLIKTKK